MHENSDPALRERTPEAGAGRRTQPGTTLWFTGLSGSGKTTLATHLEARLQAMGLATFGLDGDLLRRGLNRDLDFSAAGRMEGIRRTAEVARLMNASGTTVLAALISPLASDRELARSIIGPGRFFLVHVSTPLAVCERRDVKGLYRRARAGLVTAFTGIDSPYEVPEQAHVRIDTSDAPVELCVQEIVGAYQGFLSGRQG